MEYLVGTNLPAVNLTASSGIVLDPSKLTGICIIFCHPYTGRPGYPDPPGWDDIPGAHGSTPQALAYSRLYAEFQKLGVNVYGLSFQDRDWQKDFVERNALKVSLLSDLQRAFSDTLGLPVFRAGEGDYLQRLTIVAEDGRIVHVRYPVAAPEEDAVEVLAWLRTRPPSALRAARPVEGKG